MRCRDRDEVVLLVSESAVSQKQAEGVALAAVPGTRQNREVRKVAGQSLVTD